MDTAENKTYSSSKGVVINLRPVSQFKLDTLRSSKVETPVPTYDMQVAGGESLAYPLDAESAKNKGRMDEWNAYLEKKNAADADHAKKFLELVIWDGVDIEVPNGDSEWRKSNEYFGIKIPDNPIEQKLFYVYNELLGTPQDIGDLISQIFSVSQIDEEAVSKLRDSFRAGIQRQANSGLPKRPRKVENKKPDV